MPSGPVQSISDECYRCGYDLRGIANERPCPECGLLAERSRRVGDELHETRPKWLRSISMGVNFILLAIVTAAVLPPLLDTIDLKAASWHGIYRAANWAPLLGAYIASIILLMGILLLTRREGYAPADRGDRRLRRWLRIAAVTPILALTMETIYSEQQASMWGHAVLTWTVTNGSRTGAWVGSVPPDPWLRSTAFYLGTIGAASLSLLLFLRLRGLARRARSAELAEHCIIVGIGLAAAILYAGVVVGVNSDRDWQFRHPAALLILPMTMAVVMGLFVLWSLYLLARFAIAFGRCAREIRRKWKRDDRSSAGNI